MCTMVHEAQDFVRDPFGDGQLVLLLPTMPGAKTSTFL